MDQSIFEMFAEDNQPSPTQPSATQGAVESTTTDSYPSYDSSNSSKPIVISVGGSVILDEKPKTSFIAKLCQAINDLTREGFKICVVVGGGKLARTYIGSAKSMGANNFLLDELGIMASRLNAQLVIASLENAHPHVLTDIKHTQTVLHQNKVAVLAGMFPGLTTDAVATLTAEFLEGDFINLTNIDGIYSADPKDNPRAKHYPEVSYEKLLSLMRVAEIKPGQNLVMDIPSCLVIKRSQIKTLILNGSDLENFKAAVRGGEFTGTVVSETAAD